MFPDGACSRPCAIFYDRFPFSQSILDGLVKSDSFKHLRPRFYRELFDFSALLGVYAVSINIAVKMARRGFKVGLMDVDLHGRSTLKMLGLEESEYNKEHPRESK